jgi:hypothetical protein
MFMVLLCAPITVGVVGASASEQAKSGRIACRIHRPQPTRRFVYTRVLTPGHPSQVVHVGSSLYVLDSGSVQCHSHLADGKEAGHLRVPTPELGRDPFLGFAADRYGDLYVGRYPYTLLKYSPHGRVLWKRSLKDPLASVFVIGK